MERKNHKNQGAVNQCHSAYPPWSGHPGRKGRKFWGWTPSLLGTPTPNWPLPSSEGGDGNPAESEMNHLWLWGPRVRVASRDARALSKLRPLHPSLVGPELPRLCAVRWGESQDGLREWLLCRWAQLARRNVHLRVVYQTYEGCRGAFGGVFQPQYSAIGQRFFLNFNLFFSLCSRNWYQKEAKLGFKVAAAVCLVT